MDHQYLKIVFVENPPVCELFTETKQAIFACVNIAKMFTSLVCNAMSVCVFRFLLRIYNSLRSSVAHSRFVNVFFADLLAGRHFWIVPNNFISSRQDNCFFLLCRRWRRRQRTKNQNNRISYALFILARWQPYTHSYIFHTLLPVWLRTTVING